MGKANERSWRTSGVGDVVAAVLLMSLGMGMWGMTSEVSR